MVRVGWKFTPRGRLTMEPSDKKWDMLAPERFCYSTNAEALNEEEVRRCSDDEVSNGGSEKKLTRQKVPQTAKGRAEGFWDLETALKEVTGNLWKARWLRVTPQINSGSGTWQCWLEGPFFFKNRSTGKRDSVRHSQFARNK